MAGESYTSPVTGATYTVPSYTDPADAPIAFKDFADSITGGGGIDFDPDRVGQVVQSLDGVAWDKGMALQVVDAVPDDTAGEVGDVVFIPGGPGGLPVGGGKILQVVYAYGVSNTTSTSTSYVTTGIVGTITPSSATSKILVIASSQFSVSTSNIGYMTIFRGAVEGTNLGPANGFALITTASDSTPQSLQTAVYLDSPNTTSAQDYTIGFKTNGGSVTVNNANNGTITLMEVSA